jgi:hypothetical protein
VSAYRLAIIAFAIIFVGLGLAITALTAIRGGGLGLLLGPLFVALGLGRLYLVRAGSRSDEADPDPSGSDDR